MATNSAPVTTSPYFDYANQAWVRDGKYEDCGHGYPTPCDCYGHLHRSEPAVHSKDADCCIDANNLCLGCGVEHGEPCADCGGRGFHTLTCEASEPAPIDTLSEMIALQDATVILRKANLENASGALVVWKIVDRAQRHLNNRMAELLGEDHD